MKKIILSIVVLFFNGCIGVYAQEENKQYDKRLADSLGADDNGMKKYIFVILKTGSNKIDNKEKTDSLFNGHLANIGRLADAGLLIVAGPFKKNQKAYRGLFILNVSTADEANKLLATDPAIKEKLLEVELFTWHGSAALPLYLKSHSKIEKNKS